MNYSVSGFSILVVFLLTMVLGISIMNIIRSTTYMLDIARKCEEHEQQYYATEGLLSYGIFYAIKQNATEGIDPTVIDIGVWPPQNKNNYYGRLKIAQKDSIVHIQSFLIKNNIPIYLLSCELTKQRGSALVNSIEKEWSVISNFQHVFF